MKIRRRDQGTLVLDYNWSRRRVRGSLPLSLITAIFDGIKAGRVTNENLLAFLAGGEGGSNLAPGASIVSFDRFLDEEYLPNEAKPRLKKTSFEAEADEGKRLVRSLGEIPLHEIDQSHAEKHKKALQAQGYVNNSVKKDLHLLGRVLNYAIRCKLIKRYPLMPVRGLPQTKRSSVWLRLPDIVKLLRACDGLDQKAMTRELILFLILTGARIKEALEFRSTDINWKRGFVLMPTEKRRGKSVRMRDHMRRLDFADLGPRFVGLLKMMRSHPKTNSFFSLGDDGQPMSSDWADDLIGMAVRRAGLGHLISQEIVESGGHDHVVPHDLRRTFTNHAAIAGWSTQKIRAYLGQRHTDSIDSYLDDAMNYDPAESIFIDHRKARLSAAASHRVAVQSRPVSPAAEAPIPAIWPDNGSSQTLLH